MRRPLLTLLAALSLNAAAQTPAPPNSTLDAPLFYQLMIGELELQRGEFGVAYQLMLDGARRSGDEQLFRRAVQIALQARAGGDALTAAKAWRSQLGGAAAHQYVVQLAVALGQLQEAAVPLLEWALLGNSQDQRLALINALPQLLRSISDRERPLNEMEPLLARERDDTALPAERRMVAAALIARLAQHASNEVLALNQLHEAQRELPASELPALMALDLMRLKPEAEQLVVPRLEASLPLRSAYARQLARDHRAQDALQQFTLLRTLEPQQAAHDYAKAALLIELRRAGEALPLLDDYLRRAAHDAQRHSALQLKAQALAQLARWADMEAALAQLPAEVNPQEVAFRRALADARQGRLQAGRDRLRALPGDTPEERERRLLLEVQLLRDANQWALAFELLSQAVDEDPRDTDLLYEHAMSAERLGRFELMERQLRRIMELNPQHHHAHNALGYSLADRNQRLPEARQLIERAIELGGHEPFLVDSLGWVAFREGNLEEAERWLRQAHRARPDAEIAAHLAELLRAQGKADEARALLAEAERVEPDNAVLKATRRRLGL